MCNTMSGRAAFVERDLFLSRPRAAETRRAGNSIIEPCQNLVQRTLPVGFVEQLVIVAFQHAEHPVV